MRQFLASESLLKKMKIFFYFTLKALVVPKIFKFLFWLFVHGLIRKIMLISKSMTSQPGWQTIAIHIFTNISRSKRNQEMKFVQLIEYNMRNIFLDKPYTKCGTETIPRSFSNKSKLSTSLGQYFKVLSILF